METMTTFEKQLKQVCEKACLKMFQEGKWLKPDYANRVTIPHSMMEAAWSLVDTDSIKKQLAKRIEQELADRIMNHLAAEMATDVKKLLSNSERREALRAVARDHMKEICGV